MKIQYARVNPTQPKKFGLGWRIGLFFFFILHNLTEFHNLSHPICVQCDVFGLGTEIIAYLIINKLKFINLISRKNRNLQINEETEILLEE